VAIILQLVFLVLKILGLAGVFHRMGTSLGRSLSREMSLLGAIFLTFGIVALVLVLPHFGGLLGLAIAIGLRALYWLLIELPAVGLMILTRAGGRPRARRAPAVAPPVPPIPEPFAPSAPAP
jgi:hypothetical protein